MPYNVTPTSYGYRGQFIAPFPPAEARTWFAELKRVLPPAPRPFGQLIDAREQKIQDPDTVPIVADAQRWLQEQGMNRSAVVLSSAVLKLNLARMSKETGVIAYERYFDGTDPSWESKAMAWLTQGVEPE